MTRVSPLSNSHKLGLHGNHKNKDEADLLREVENFIKKKIPDEIDHEFHRESILNAVRTFKTSRRKQAQKKNKKKKPKQWALKRKPRSLKDLSD